MTKLHFILLGVTILIAVVFLSFSSERMRSWQGSYLRVSNPALQAGSALSDQVTKLQRGLKTLDQLEEENAALTAQNNQLRAANQLLGDLETENKSLRAALDYRERSAFKLLPAQIISRDASSWWNTAKVNRGFAQDVESAQPVLTAEGLVGRTTTVSKDLSIILLLTDENCQVAARVAPGQASVQDGQGPTRRRQRVARTRPEFSQPRRQPPTRHESFHRRRERRGLPRGYPARGHQRIPHA